VIEAEEKVPPIRYLQDIKDHIKKHFGDDSFWLHEDRSSVVHVDVHVVRPSAERPFFTLTTSGMSDLDMEVPAGAEDWVLAEACLCLPKEWPLGVEDFGWREPQFFWPISLLHKVARYPTDTRHGSAGDTPQITEVLWRPASISTG
jgi:hypothetical protein